ncbi:MAG: hypothetical protein AAGI30_13460 [Planctomycetota bacterium]
MLIIVATAALSVPLMIIAGVGCIRRMPDGPGTVKLAFSGTLCALGTLLIAEAALAFLGHSVLLLIGTPTHHLDPIYKVWLAPLGSTTVAMTMPLLAPHTGRRFLGMLIGAFFLLAVWVVFAVLLYAFLTLVPLWILWLTFWGFLIGVALPLYQTVDYLQVWLSTPPLQST